MEKILLEEMVGGALQEQFAKEFEKVVHNLSDPNTPYKPQRKITITMKFTQNEQRDDVACDIIVDSKLAAQNPMATAFAVGKDLRTGEVFANEYGKNIKGQYSFENLPEVDMETGEVIEEDTAQVPAVIDLRRAAN